MKKKITIALAGNPNAGKTTIFNNITGARQHVGNYPGVTVERKEGFREYKDYEIKVVDLPGTYSLTAYSQEEVIARNVLIDETPDVVVDIIDTSNLERNLYLSVQLIEMGVPLLLAFNMSDVAQAKGYQFDLKKLSGLLGVPIVETVGHKNRGTNELLDAILSVHEHDKAANPGIVRYGDAIEKAIGELSATIDEQTEATLKQSHWIALKLLEDDPEIAKEYPDESLRGKVRQISSALEIKLEEPVPTAIASHRYGMISGACTQAVRSTIELRHSVSDVIDMVATNRFLGIPVFLGLMYLVFWLTFTVGAPMMDWLDVGFGWLGDVVSGWWAPGSESALKSLLVDGIIGGVGGVLIFLPNILLLFLAIAFLEDTGYMARAAFIMDRLMHKIGLHGKSFIPMLVGFGCSVPAIMATRTLDNRRDRLVTMMVVPLMSCGARLPIYALIIPAFFPQVWHAPMLWIIYVIGILLAIISAKLLRSTILKGESVPFLMELPPYRMPTFKGIFTHMWQRGWLYLKKAGTIILGFSILMWVITTYPQKKEFDRDYEHEITVVEQATDLSQEQKDEQIEVIQYTQAAEALSYTVAGRIGHALEPVIKPMGFDWRIGTALIGAFAAKELFVAQLGIVYSVGEADEESQSLRDKLKENYTPLIGFAIMLFSLISMPCMATVAVTKREANSWKWALFQVAGLTIMAWLVTTIVYQVGTLF